MNSGTSATGFFLRLLPWGFCAALLVVMARNGQTPAPAPTLNGEGAVERAREKADRLRRNRNAVITEEEWKQAKEFLRPYSPHRLARVRALEERGTAKSFESLKRNLVDLWLDLSSLKDESPELYNTRLREVKLADDIFGLCLELQKNHTDKKAQADLKTKINEQFLVGITARKQRITLVEKELTDQRRSITADEQNQTQLVDAEFTRILSTGVPGARLGKHPGVKKTGPSTGPTSSESEESAEK